MKTYNQFLNTPFSEEVKPEPPAEEDQKDNQIASKQKRQMQIKKQVLLKKMQAVRAGAGADIVASHTPEGEMVEGKVSTGPRLGEPREKGATHVNAGEGEKIQKRTKKWMDKKGQKGAPGLDAMKARTAEHKAKRGVKEDWKPEIEHSKLGDAKKKKDKERESKLPPHLQGDAIGKMKKAFASEGTDKAFEYVKKQIAAKYGKSGYVSKDNPRKPQSAADKAKARAHQAKVDAENAAERKKDPSQGRYPKG